MSERPEPDIDQVREAMRARDARTPDEGDEPEPERDDDDGDADDNGD